MGENRPPGRFRFGVFEADSTTGELRRRGIRVKLHAQPFQVLFMLLDRPGEILTREEICQELWPEGTFVDYEHGVNSAVNRLREALGDKASNPKFVETLSRRGYRFVAPVERIGLADKAPANTAVAAADRVSEGLDGFDPGAGFPGLVLASPEDLPKISPAVVQTLFILLQIMYLGFYAGALINLPEIEEFFSPLRFGRQAFGVTMLTAALLIPVRAFLICAVLFHAPGIRGKFLKMWWLLLPLDGLWSLAPFLLHNINNGLALTSMTLLVYSPFAQRSLILMGAGRGVESSAEVDTTHHPSGF